MAAAVGLRGDYDAGALRVAAKRSKIGLRPAGSLAVAAIYDGATRSEAAKIWGCETLQIIGDWVMRFNARGAAGLLHGDIEAVKPRGRQQQIHAAPQRGDYAGMIESGPISAIDGVVRCGLIDLAAMGSLNIQRRHYGREADAKL